ncbi:histidine kinase [Psychromonas sp. B3M02]|uniref:EAL and HDOD domain-containing protein n=1 Tax=Psychromonas sp. B3M02 TaxID=2267226 RepID=UPI000DEB9631|nr:HDOD domain-containing protein [Psychromonas sp. B3M02]RBW46324.1 histidine kinase [Psychromonas sp. B3M02]
MSSYVARQPIVDRDKQTVAFELLYRDGEENSFPDVSADYATKSILVNQILVHQKRILDGKTGFVNFGYDSLLDRLPFDFSYKNYVIEILENCPPSDELFQIVVELKEKGYTVALDDFVPSKEWLKFYPYIDIIKFDITTYPLDKAGIYLKKLAGLDIKFLAERVETYEEFNQAKECGFELFQGYFFSKPEVVQSKILDSSVSAKIQLSVAVSQEELDFVQIENIIASNPGLSFKLLSFVNEYSMLKAPIKSLQQALLYLGEDRVRKFITFAVIKTLNSDKPSILSNMSLQRAKFFELLLCAIGLEDKKELGYLCGMLSIIDALLDADMAAILTPLNINQEIKDALLGKQGDLNNLIKLAAAVEVSDWKKVDELTSAMGITEEEVINASVQSTLWADEISA